MHHVANAVILQHFEHGQLVPQINVFKDEFRVRRNTFEVFKMSRIGQAIKVYEQFDLGLIDNRWIRFDPINPATGYEHSHLSFRWQW